MKRKLAASLSIVLLAGVAYSCGTYDSPCSETCGPAKAGASGNGSGGKVYTEAGSNSSAGEQALGGRSTQGGASSNGGAGGIVIAMGGAGQSGVAGCTDCGGGAGGIAMVAAGAAGATTGGVSAGMGGVGGELASAGAAGAAGAAGVCGCDGPDPVNLRTAGNYAILTKAGITNIPPSVITGNLGVSPIAATAITGFVLILDSSGVFSTSTQVVGRVYAADYASPTPSNLTTAINDLQTAFNDAAGRSADVVELGAGDIGGLSIKPGVYKWGTGLLVPIDVTLAGGPNGVWIFEVAQNLTLSSGAQVKLTGGAKAKNIFWQVSGAVTMNTTSHLEGVLLCATAVSIKAGASVNGRILAQTAGTLAGATVTQPAP